MLVALRTAPGNSWSNPVERLMSIVNLGLQGVGVIRQKGSESLEAALKPENNMKAVRDVLSNSALEDDWRASMEPTLKILNKQMTKLSLKEKPFTPETPATVEDIEGLWTHCFTVDETIQVNMSL